MIVTCDICNCVSTEETENCYFNVSVSDYNISDIIETETIHTVWDVENRTDYYICDTCFKNWVKDKWDKIIVVYRVVEPIETKE